MNVIVTKGDNGRIIGMRFADSFYQNHYKWAEGEMDFQSIN